MITANKHNINMQQLLAARDTVLHDLTALQQDLWLVHQLIEYKSQKLCSLEQEIVTKSYRRQQLRLVVNHA